MKHERIGIGSEFGDDERNPLDHKTGNEGDVTRQSIELGNYYRTLGVSRPGEGGCQLRAPVQGIRALSGFDLSELLDDGNPLGFSEAGNRGTLCLDAQT